MSPTSPNTPSATLRWLYVDFNSYFASVEQQLDARLRGKPVIVVPVETDSTSAIAASYEAKALGIKTGTPVWEAKKRCPDIICIATEFADFRSFLKHMGPRPSKAYTLDRLDPTNPEYGPWLCQWRDKKDQANNRQNTIFITYEGECLALTVWAERTKQKPDTLRRRKNKGLSDKEIIEGKLSELAQEKEDCYPTIWPGDIESRRNWENRYQIEGIPKKLSRMEYVLQKLCIRIC